MKNTLLLIAFAFSFTTVISQNKAEFKFVKEIINYGKITKGSNGVKVFEFTNIGQQPLIVTDIKTSCGCTVPKKPTEPIMPGKKGSIEVSYDTSIIGGFIKQITIFSNAKNSKKKIRIKGFVVEKKV